MCIIKKEVKTISINLSCEKLKFEKSNKLPDNHMINDLILKRVQKWGDVQNLLPLVRTEQAWWLTYIVAYQQLFLGKNIINISISIIYN